MSKSYEKKNSHEKHLEVNYECKDCKDTGMLFEKVTETINYKGDEKEVTKDIGRHCHCVSKKALISRFKNALIPDEFKNARFDSYERYDETTELLFNATKEYLQNFPTELKGDEVDSLGFIAVIGESQIRRLNEEDRYMAKEKHNNFGLGKTHLQMAAAKWLLNNVKVYDEIAPGQHSKYARGCTVLCISDREFMDNLTHAQMADDGGKELNDLIYGAINADVLVWDDLGKTKWSESKEGFYYRIINERYIHNRPIIFSSNEDEGTLSDKIGYAASSRLFGMCGERLYAVEGQDYRLTKGGDRQ